MKSNQDIEALQAEWLEAPHFPLEETEGFGQHKEALKQFRQRQDAIRAEARQKADAETRAKVNDKATLLQTSPQVAQHLMWLEARQKELHTEFFAFKPAWEARQKELRAEVLALEQAREERRKELRAEVLALKQAIADMKSSAAR
jgi:hypothetical protein